MARRKKDMSAQPDIFAVLMADQATESVIDQLPENIYLISHIGISKGFNDKWMEFVLSGEDFAIDCETYHKDMNKKASDWDASIRLISVSPRGGEYAFIFDMGTSYIPNTSPPPEIDNYLKELAILCADDTIQKWGQNLKFDMVRLRHNYGWQFSNCGDTMLLSQIIWNFSSKEQVFHNLADIATRCGIEIDKAEQSSNWGDGNLGAGRLSKDQYVYSANDVILLWQIIDHLSPKINNSRLKTIVKTEFQFLEVLSDMEYGGFYCDPSKASEYLKLYREEEFKLTKIIVDAFGSDLKDKKLKQRLSGIAGREVDSANAESLQEFIHIKGVEEILLRRTIQKYIEVLEKIIGLGESGYLRSQFWQLIFTCRTASSEPNLQNIPNSDKTPKRLKHLPKIRSLFVAPPGQKMIISDLSAAHARIAIEASRDKKLIEFYTQDKDLHLYTASLVASAMGDPLTFDQMTEIYKDKSHPKFNDVKRYRGMAKNVFYGSLNLQGYRTLQATILSQTGELLSDEQAQNIIRNFKEGYKGLSTYMNDVCRDANKAQHTFHKIGIHKEYACITGLTGRHSYHVKMPSQYHKENTAKSNDMVAFIWASTEADIMKWSAIRLAKLFKQNPQWGARIANFVHDELDVYSDEQYALEVAEATVRIMDEEMAKIIKCIPVNDPGNSPHKAIVNSWADK